MFAMRMPVRVGVVFLGVLVLVRVLQRRVSLGGCMGVLVLRIVVVLVVMMHVPLFAVPVSAFMRMLMPMLVRVPVIMSAFMLMRAMLHMRRAAVDVEFHALDVLPLCAVIVHVEVADVQLAQLPFERAGFHAEVEECADHHVAADAGNAVEVEGFHGKLGVGS